MNLSSINFFSHPLLFNGTNCGCQNWSPGPNFAPDQILRDRATDRLPALIWTHGRLRIVLIGADVLLIHLPAALIPASLVHKGRTSISRVFPRVFLPYPKTFILQLLFSRTPTVCPLSIIKPCRSKLLASCGHDVNGFRACFKIK